MARYPDIDLPRTPSASPSLATRPVVPLAGDVVALPDGTLVELVRPANKELKLLLWKAGSAEVVEEVECDGNILVPPVLPDAVSRHIRFPTATTPCGSPEEVFGKVSGVISYYVELPPPSIHLAAAFAVSTWFPDMLTIAPYLMVHGPCGGGKTTLLRLLQALCRRPLLMAGDVPSQVLRLVPEVRPTLLLDDFHLTRELRTWLRAGNCRGVPVNVAGELVDSFGPKVLSSELPLLDKALDSRAVHVSMIPTMLAGGGQKESIPVATLDQIAADMQNEMLTFRLAYHSRVSAAGRWAFNSRMQDLARALMAVFPDGPPRQAIGTALLEQNEAAAGSRLEEVEGSVTLALFELGHERPHECVLIGEIAARVNRHRAQLEEKDLEPCRVGRIMKALGIAKPDKKRASAGVSVELTRRMNARIHKLARAYGLAPRQGCPLCDGIVNLQLSHRLAQSGNGEPEW